MKRSGRFLFSVVVAVLLGGNAEQRAAAQDTTNEAVEASQVEAQTPPTSRTRRAMDRWHAYRDFAPRQVNTTRAAADRLNDELSAGEEDVKVLAQRASSSEEVRDAMKAEEGKWKKRVTELTKDTEAVVTDLTDKTNAATKSVEGLEGNVAAEGEALTALDTEIQDGIKEAKGEKETPFSELELLLHSMKNLFLSPLKPGA